jgi:hypothetical protein
MSDPVPFPETPTPQSGGTPIDPPPTKPNPK